MVLAGQHMTLYIANKDDPSGALRAWLALRRRNAPFEVVDGFWVHAPSNADPSRRAIETVPSLNPWCERAEAGRAGSRAVDADEVCA